MERKVVSAWGELLWLVCLLNAGKPPTKFMMVSKAGPQSEATFLLATCTPSTLFSSIRPFINDSPVVLALAKTAVPKK
jgi:hypothetical protein